MHVLNRARARPRAVTAVVPERPIDPRHRRRFHTSLRTRSTPKPDHGPPAESSEDKPEFVSEEKGNAGSSDHGGHREATDNSANSELRSNLRKDANQSRFRNTNSASSRASRTQRLQAIPPIHVPRWFLQENVRLCDRKAPVAENQNQPEETITDIHDLATGKIIITLREESLGQGNGKDDLGESAHDSTAPSEPVDTQNEICGDQPKSGQITAGQWIQAEIKASIFASISIVDSQIGPDMSRTKAHLVLQSPMDGGLESLESLVERIAIDIHADVISFDPTDVAEFVGAYVGDGVEDARGYAHPIRNLSFDTYRSMSQLRQWANQNAPAPSSANGEQEEEENEDEMARNALNFPRVGIRIGAIHLGGLGRYNSRSDMIRNIKSMSINSNSESKGSENASDTPQDRSSQFNAQREDLKLSAALSALVNANQMKSIIFQKFGSDESYSSTSTNGAPSRRESMPDTIAAAIRTIKGFIRNPSITKTKIFTKTSCARRIESPNIKLERRPRIIVVKDVKELDSHPSGRRVLQKLVEVVQAERKEGNPVMIVGLTAAADLLPDASETSIRMLEEDREFSPFRTIVIPLEEVGSSSSIVVEKPEAAEVALEDSFTKAEEAKNMRVNLRNISSMINRLDPRTFDMDNVSNRSQQLPFELPGCQGLRRRILSFDETHRIAMAALGVCCAFTTSDTLTNAHVAIAINILHFSEITKFDWAEKERHDAQELQQASAASARLKAPNIDAESRQNRSQKKYNTHEKRLLSGVVNSQNIRTTFADVHAAPTTIEALKTLTSLSLVRPDAFEYGVLAADRISGVLLYGPPGTGKTLLAKAVAKESGATVLEASGSEVYDMYVGEGEKNVKAIFTLAQKLSPCVVFIDEADAIFGSRSSPTNRNTHREIINQFLREWDGMSNAGVFVMVATNRPFDLDDAVLRRLPRRLLVDLPVEKDREAILRIHLKDENLDPEVSLPRLAAQTPLYSGSDLKNLCVAAALACVREEYEAARQQQSAPPPPPPPPQPQQQQQAKEGQEPQPQEEKLDQQEDNESQATNDSAAGNAAGASGGSLYPKRRTLRLRHFEKGMDEISASISEDMSSLVAMKQFDEKYGDRRGRRKKATWGFGALGEKPPDEGNARVRV